MNKKTAPEDRFQAVIKLASFPKNGCSIRVRNNVNCQEGQGFSES